MAKASKKASKKGQKIGVLILYVIILLGLLVGFFIPLNLKFDNYLENTLMYQIPAALENVLGTLGIHFDALTNALAANGGSLPALAISAELSLGSSITVDFNAWLTVIYAVVTVLAVICIIPAIVGCVTKKDKATRKAEKEAKKQAKAAKKAGNEVADAAADQASDPFNADSSVAPAAGTAVQDTAVQAQDTAAADDTATKKKKKKTKETTYHTAFTLEVIAAVVLLIMNFFIMLNMAYEVEGATYCAPLVIAFGVLVIAGFVQRCIASKGSGVVKFILFLLSLIAVVFAFFDIAKLSPSTGEWISGGLPEALATGVFGGNSAAGLENFSYFIFASGEYTLFGNGLSAAMWAFEIAGIILAIMILLNCLLDLLGIYKSTNKFMLVANQVRYLIEIAAIIVCVIIPFVVGLDELKFGIMFIVLVVMAVAAYIINLVRLIRYNRAKKAAAAEAEAAAAAEEEARKNTSPDAPEPAHIAADTNFYGSVETVAPEAPVETPAAETYVPAPAAPAEVPVAAPVQPIVNSNVIYNVHTIYNGPTDKFIAKLTNDEKVEFARVFLERLNGALETIPEYKVGGDNAKFFSNVIIYYARVRDLISDGLMNKLYEEAKVM